MSAPLPIFVVNLDRAEERWARISAEAAALGAELHRVRAVDGRQTPPESWLDVDAAAFGARHGRSILPGEYGCHRSHLKALEALERSGAAHGLILEDDVSLSAEGLAAARTIAESGQSFDAVKLMNHRVKGFLPKFSVELPTGEELEIGLALHGPQGSAAGYLVSRAGAERLRQRLTRLTLPWDVALERYWSASGGTVYTTPRNLFGFSELQAQSAIGDRSVYRATKFPAWRRLPTLGFRAAEYLRRAGAAVARQAEREAPPEA